MLPASVTATAASRPSRRYGQASSDGVPQLSPAMTVVPVGTLTRSPRLRLARTQLALSGSTASSAGAGPSGRLR